MSLTQYITRMFASLSILAIFITLAALVALISKWKTGTLPKWGNFLAGFALPLSTIMAASAMAGSLFYSEIAHYTPCILCWYQRIAMYPMVVIGFVAGVSKKKWSPEMLILAIIGGAIALYQYLLQLGVIVSSSCEEIAGAVSCSERVFMTFGFVTIPFMALSVFVTIIALQLLARAGTDVAVPPQQ